MFISPHDAIAEGWVTGIKDLNKQIQPNAIDFTLDTLYKIQDDSWFSISELDKTMKLREEIPASKTHYHGRNQQMTLQWDGWVIDPKGMYDGMSDMYVNVPDGVAVMLVTRSTLVRNCMFITSGLYDSGFKGHVGFVLHNRSNTFATIAQGTRVGQIIFVKSDSAGLYAGGYNHEEGTFYTSDEQQAIDYANEYPSAYERS